MKVTIEIPADESEVEKLQERIFEAVTAVVDGRCLLIEVYEIPLWEVTDYIDNRYPNEVGRV